ncbi:hypothetical protein SAMN05660477_01475 [Soonwooa buanensis]|uniref:Uncharacterized protein n=1 Tax=Soonwooa buanensis TaxID=619805 RepID=A0A1T5EPD6_9FLAO|nr:hypothetical protein SAMN05660477_01475 [Soonwooa buanensis]
MSSVRVDFVKIISRAKSDFLIKVLDTKSLRFLLELTITKI